MNDYRSVMLSIAPFAYWRLDESSGNLIDLVGAREAAVSGTATRDSVGLLTGDPNNAIVFGGGNAAASANAAWALGTDNFSISLIVKYTTSSLMCPLSIRVSGSTPILCLILTARVASGDIAAETWAWSDVNTRCRSGRACNDGKPHHVVVTYNHLTYFLSLYVDGMLLDARAQTSARPTSFSPGVCIANNYGGSQPFSGTLDEVALWDRLVTGEEVVRLYDCYAKGAIPRRTRYSRRKR